MKVFRTVLAAVPLSVGSLLIRLGCWLADVDVRTMLRQALGDEIDSLSRPKPAITPPRQDLIRP